LLVYDGLVYVNDILRTAGSGECGGHGFHTEERSNGGERRVAARSATSGDLPTPLVETLKKGRPWEASVLA